VLLQRVIQKLIKVVHLDKPTEVQPSHKARKNHKTCEKTPAGLPPVCTPWFSCHTAGATGECLVYCWASRG
jgi:hypothetical protein